MVFWLIPNGREKCDYAGALWTKFIVIPILKWTVNIKSQVEGLENFKKGKAYIIVGKHESTWDTMILHTFMKPVPVFILKRELLKIPFFGWCLARASKIAIDRKGGASSIRKIIKEGKKYIAEGHSIVIFPQGTRVPYDSSTKNYRYKGGFIALIKEMGVDIIPMALNSGKLWGKKQFLKYPGTITMKFMKPIKYEEIKDMDKDEIIKKLESIIEIECQKLNKL